MLSFTLLVPRVPFCFFFPCESQGAQINEAACDLAREVANEGDALVAGGVSQTPSYLSCKSEEDVKTIFKKQLDVFVKKDVDFLIAEVCSEYSACCLPQFKGGLGLTWAPWAVLLPK